jgi:D-amino-acid oxidase
VQVTVVGAGVVGLVTALVLEEHGHEVRIVAAAGAEASVSSVAGAIWFPYRAGPPDRVPAWAERTRVWLESLIPAHAPVPAHAGGAVPIADPIADPGIDMVTDYEITGDLGEAPPLPWWAAPGLALERAPAPVTGAPLAWRFRAPRVEPARFLPWLAARLRAPIERRVVVDLAAEPGDAVINCTGLGARDLASDEQIKPLLGQIVITECGEVDRALSLTDERDPDELFYLIPRREELVLGGCSIPWPPGRPPEADPARTARILAQARELGLFVGPVRQVKVGLRPYRLEVRLERDPHDPRVIHNYGHGGAGFTMCRGCAEEVAGLLALAGTPTAT